MTETEGGFAIDEEPLRHWILKAYHEKRKTAENCFALTEAIRELLSGPLDETGPPGRYYFEREPDTSLWLFVKSLNAVAEGLGRAVYEPLLAVIAEKAGNTKEAFPPNLSVFVASLAGPVALKKGVDETVVCALISAALLTLARLGTKRVETLIKEEKKARNDS